MTTILEIRGSFRLMAGDGGRLRGRSFGTWTCRCGAEAQAEHGNPRCEICSHGGDCGHDCTLSGLVCPDCGKTA